MSTTRRDFFKNSSIMTAGISLSSVLPSMSLIDKYNPSDRLNLAVIGVGQGCWDLQGALKNNPWVHCIAMCDVNKERLEEQAASFRKEFPIQTANIRLYDDFRKLLENNDIDGVIIAPPDHWHAYIFAEALKSGKAIYVEKPVANTIEECNLMMDLQIKYKSIVTTGLWQTSQSYFIAANEILKTGVLGELFKVQLWHCQTTNPRAKVENTKVPASIDYEMWLGPAPKKPFNDYRFRSWRGFWDYGGGQQTDWGVHWIDSAFDGLVAMGLSDRKFPIAVFSTAFKHPDTFNETPSCQTTIFQYENFHIEWAQQVAYLYNRNQGIAWIGSKATLVCNRAGYELIPEKDRNGEYMAVPVKFVGKAEEGGVANHVTNWCNCILNKSVQTNSPVEKGVFATILAHMGNISFRTQSRVVYDPVHREFQNNPLANKLIKANYRGPWNLPKV